MKRRSFLKHLGLAASLSGLARTALAANVAPAKAGGDSHKILSCNVRVDLAQDNEAGDGWQHRKELCADVIRAQKADLVGLQETELGHLQDLKQRMPEFDSFALANPAPGFAPLNAVLFLRSRYELISAGGFWLSETPHVAGSKSWDSMFPRFANWVHLKDRRLGKEFRFWNTHLDHMGHEARAKGAAMIVEASAPFPQDFPQLLTGDMNADFNHPAIKNFLNGGWRDTHRTVHGPDDPGYTYHGFKGPKYVPRRSGDGVGRQIDWVFCRGAVKPLAAEIIRDGRNNRYPSDHYFVAAEVTF
jgi:endonuclease/exonuclease/phosphatase family metal-dependent hydrolase